MKPSPSASPGPSIQRQRGLDIGPQLRDGRVVAGPLGVEAGEHDEQRRRIDAAVIEAEGDFAQRRHLAAAHLVQDLARLRVRLRIVALGLQRRQSAQHAVRHAGIEPEHLQRGDQTVAAERRRIPGDAGVGIAALRRVGHQHAEVGHRPAEHFVEEVVRRSRRWRRRASRRAERGAPPAIRAGTGQASAAAARRSRP